MRAIGRSLLAGLVLAAVSFVPLLAPGSAGAATAATTAKAGTPRVLSCTGGHRLYKPKNHYVACADGNIAWRNVTWTTWRATTATGRGTLHENDCIPYCYNGHFHNYAAALKLWRPVKTKKYGLLFSRVTFSYSVKGKHKVATYTLGT